MARVDFNAVPTNEELWENKPEGEEFRFSVAFCNGLLHLVYDEDGDFGHSDPLTDEHVDQLEDLIKQWKNWRTGGKTDG